MYVLPPSPAHALFSQISPLSRLCVYVSCLSSFASVSMWFPFTLCMQYAGCVSSRWGVDMAVGSWQVAEQCRTCAGHRESECTALFLRALETMHTVHSWTSLANKLLYQLQITLRLYRWVLKLRLGALGEYCSECGELVKWGWMCFVMQSVKPS